MTSWQQFPFFQMTAPWSRSILSYRTLTSIVCHGGVFSLYISSYAPLAYALDGKQHAMFWLSPANKETDPFSPVLQHWQSAMPIRADILPGMHFFDAWRIVLTMQIEPDDHKDLDSFEEVLSPREKWEFRAQNDARTDAQLAQEQTLQARAQNKTSAQMASKIAQVHKLTTLLAEQIDFLANLACSRHGFFLLRAPFGQYGPVAAFEP